MLRARLKDVARELSHPRSPLLSVSGWPDRPGRVRWLGPVVGLRPHDSPGRQFGHTQCLAQAFMRTAMMPEPGRLLVCASDVSWR